MEDYYHRFLTSMSGVGVYSSNSVDDADNEAHSDHLTRQRETTMRGSHHSFGHLNAYSDQALVDVSSISPGRKKSLSRPTLGSDHVKRRRTRSGCFMCRSRRIKCDETRPVCERCTKASRDCIYPDPPAVKSTRLKTSDKASQRASPGLSQDYDQQSIAEQESIAIKDDRQSLGSPAGQETDSEFVPLINTNSHFLSTSDDGHHSSESESQNDSELPHVSGSGQNAATTTAFLDLELSCLEQPGWAHLPADYQFYLDFFVENITKYHYSMCHDEDDFFGTLLPSLAVRHEPLLNALVGFSTYHATLRNPDGDLKEFLGYYNRSVTLLLELIERRDMDNVLTLLTILQLLTIEEHFGDWINLLGHQKAAFRVITKIFTPETALRTAVGRACLEWYSRYDCFVAIQGGFPTDLPKNWFKAMEEHHRSRVTSAPGDLGAKISLRAVQLRVISYDMSMLYARGSRGQMSAEDFVQEHSRITTELLRWKETWDGILSLPEYLETDLSYRKQVDKDDIIDPYVPGILYKPPLLTNTLINAEWESIMIMHLSQSSETANEDIFVEMSRHAYTICQYFETVELWPSKPNGALNPLQCCLSIASLFLPRDQRHQMWIRRKFALLDRLGFIYPTTRRRKIAELFRDPSCARWWLPDDEGLTPILRAIHAFADERSKAAYNSQYDNICEVRHLFAKVEAAQMALLQARDHASGQGSTL